MTQLEGRLAASRFVRTKLLAKASSSKDDEIQDLTADILAAKQVS